MKRLFLQLFCFYVNFSHSQADASLYQVLNSKFSDSKSQIIENYNKLIEKYPVGSSQRKALDDAFRIISDRVTRSIYDMDGINEVRNYLSLGSKKAHRRYKKAKPITTSIELSLKDSMYGISTKIKYNRSSICQICRGTGAKGGELKQCDYCHGRGMTIETIRQMGFVMQMQKTCPKCNGRRTIFAHKCPVCSGNKLIIEENEHDIEIKPGVKDGDKLVITGEGNSVLNGIPGDLIVEIKITPDNKFQREGSNLITHIEIPFKDALLGFERVIKGLDGSDITIRKDNPTQIGELIPISNLGFPLANAKNERGDLRVKVNWILPDNLSGEQLKGIETIFSGDDYYKEF